MISVTDIPVKSDYISALRTSLWQQLPLFVLCVLMLDRGRTLRLCLIAMLGYWLFTMVCLTRGHRQTDHVGLWFVRWGFIPLFVVILSLNGWIHPLAVR